MSVEYPIGGGAVVLLDPEDVEHVARHKWAPITHPRTTYAQANVWRDDKRGTLLLHRFIARAADNEHVDHRNGDGLDCRKSNLRTCLRFQNNRNARPRTDNSSGFKGVSWYAAMEKWAASITIDDKKRHIGYFDTAAQAAHAYDVIAQKEWGEFAWLNLPEERIEPARLDEHVRFLFRGKHRGFLARRWAS